MAKTEKNISPQQGRTLPLPVRPGAEGGSWIYLVLCPLIVIVPFVNFIKHHGYGYLAGEVLLILAVCVGVGVFLGLLLFRNGLVSRPLMMAALIFLFADIQLGGSGIMNQIVVLAAGGAAFALWRSVAHIAKIATAVFGAIFLSTVLLPSDGVAPETASAAPMPAGRVDLPPVLHIVLDEHAGPEGIPTVLESGAELKERLRSFYESHGFRLYGKAYSLFADTVPSLAHMANLLESSDPGQTGLFVPDGANFRLERNAYFERLQKAGYRLQVYQTGYLDFCAGLDTAPALCRTTAINDLRAVRDSSLPRRQKASAIAKLFMERSSPYSGVRIVYGVVQNLARNNGIMLPFWAIEEFRVSSLPAMQVLEDLGSGVSNASAGDFFFAHVLLPHHPYALDSDCGIRAPGDWLIRQSVFVPGRLGLDSSLAFAQRLHGRYHEQITCLYTILEKIMDGINDSPLAERFIVILHGDHGSKIQTRYPLLDNADQLTSHEMIQNYSTLFAVRAPAIAPGESDERRAVQELFKTFVESGFASLHPSRDAKQKPFVYLSQEEEPLAYGAARLPLIDFENGQVANRP